MKKHKVKHAHHHGPPITRRDFLSQGIISVSAFSMIPTVLSLTSRAEAACIPMGAAAGTIPFFVIDLAGGAAMAGNFLAGKVGGPEDLLSSYDQLGWDPRAAGALDKRFGLPMSAKYSKMLEGIIASASTDSMKKLKMASICHFSQADTGNMNRHSAAVLVTELGARGSFVGTGVGTRQTASGGHNGVPIAKPAYQPLALRRYEDLEGALSYGKKLVSGTSTRLPSGAIEAMAKSISNLSQLQAAKIADINNGPTLANLVNCGLASNVALANPVPVNMDPRKDAAIAAIWGLTATTPSSDEDVVLATIAMNTLMGVTGPGVLALGGFDNHTNEQTAGDAADLRAGLVLGRLIETAHRLNRPMMFQIVTDGSLGAFKGTRDWYIDTPHTMTIMGYFSPNATLRPKFQLGNFKDGQGADGATVIGSSTAKVAYAVFANYLSICGKLGDFRKYVAEDQFPTPAGGLDELILFG